MKRNFLIMLIVLFNSCQQKEIPKLVETKPTPIFTDSVISEDYELKVKFNSYDQFDTSYKYIYTSCVFDKKGYRLIDTSYEAVNQHESSWRAIESDSLMRMTISFQNAGKMRIADQRNAMSMFEENRAVRAASAYNSVKPLFCNSEKIGTNFFSYICFKDTLDRTDGLQTSILLNAETFIDSIEISLSFNCLSSNCEGSEKKFLRTLRSVEIEKL